MNIQKIPYEQKSSTIVTSTQLTLVFLLMGVVAGLCASLLLGMQDKLRGGLGFWYTYLVVGLALCLCIALGYLKLRHKARKLSLPSKH
jgi:hypothetical protein